MRIIQHVAFTYDSIHDLLKSYHQRKALGFKPLWCVNHGPTMSICRSPMVLIWRIIPLTKMLQIGRILMATKLRLKVCQALPI